MVEKKGLKIKKNYLRRNYIEVMKVKEKEEWIYKKNERMLREEKEKGFNNEIVKDVIGNVEEKEK